MPPLAVIGAIGIGSAVAGSVGASKAAGAQAKAANYAATLQKQEADAALAFQKQQYADQQKNLAPWLQAGTQAVNTLSGMVEGGGFPAWNEQFQAPTNVTEQNDPGYQFRLNEGMKALQNSAAARGNLLSGGTAKAITQYGQDYASNEYSNVYNRAYNEYATRYNQFEQNQANQFNRLSTLAGGGQVAANTLGQLGQSAAGNVANINLGLGQQLGQDAMNAGTARASGYAGITNAITGGLGNLSQYLLLKNLMGGTP
jgi:hypothetical protein